MDLHPYDGQERRFRHQDTGDRGVALIIIERLLATPLPSPPPRLLYDLRFDANNANGWSPVYVEDGWLHYLAYEQG